MKQILILVMCCGIFLPVFPEKPAKEPPKDLPYKNLAVFMESLMLLREKYVDTGKITYENLLRAAMRGMMRELDPFSNYETPDQFKHIQEDTRGNFPGVGMTVASRNGLIMVVSVIAGSPAAKAGIISGDILMEIDGKPLQGISLADCVKKLKGPAGTIVRIKIYRRKGDQTKEFNVKRAVIKISSVTGIGMVSDRIGYLRITHFTETTVPDLDRALERLEKMKMEALVIDLRNNPGGLLKSAVGTVSRFITEKRPVVSVEGRAEKKVGHNAVNCKKYLKLPVAILINGNSASASEIVAACLQDYKRAVLVGSRSFGKGSVQVILPLSDGGALRMTTAKYYTPGRKEIHGKGVTPDITINLSPMASVAVAQHLSLHNDKPPKIREKNYHDAQLERAVEILKGINIFRHSGE